MKATTVAVFALTAASVCAQPIVIPKEYYYPRTVADLADLEARGWHWPKINWRPPKINWHQVGSFAKNAAKIGAEILLRRMDENELYARGFIDNPNLVTRDYDDYLEARDFGDDHLEARAFDDDYLEARDFDDDYLEQRGLDFLELRAEQDDDDGDRPPAHFPHRLLRHGAVHNKVGKSGKLRKIKGTGFRAAAASRPLRPASNKLDDLN